MRTDYSANYVLGGMFIFLCTIPWVSFGTNSMDSQPWPIIASVIFVFSIQHTHRHRWDIVLAVIYTAACVSLGLTYFQPDLDFLLIRGIINYLGFITILLACCAYFERFGFPIKILIVANIIWLFVGVVQVYDTDFLAWISPNRTRLNRGVTSIAAEPTFFAIFLFFTNWIYLIIAKYQPSKKLILLMITNVGAIIVLAQSAMVAIYLVISVGFVLIALPARVLFGKRFLTALLSIIVLLFFGGLIFGDYLSGLRIGNIYAIMTSQNPLNIFFKDASANSRLASIVLPLHGAVYNFGMPGGFQSYDQIVYKVVPFYDGYFWHKFGNEKILSWMAAWVYELGFPGVLLYAFLNYVAKDGTKRRIVELSLMFVLLFSAIPLNFPLIPMIFALFIVYGNKSMTSDAIAKRGRSGRPQGKIKGS